VYVNTDLNIDLGGWLSNAKILLVSFVYLVSSLLYHLIVTLWIVSSCILLYLV
jgi:hypothetical protein